MPAFSRCLATIIFLVACAQPVLASIPVKTACGEDAPIALTAPAVAPEGTKATVNFTNVSTKPITAVFLRWRFVSSTGASSTALSWLELGLEGLTLLPGKADFLEVDLDQPRSGVLTEIEVSCEAILFVGFDVWGNGKLPELRELWVGRKAVKRERSRLLRAYEQGGTEKLIEEVKTPVITSQRDLPPQPE